MFKGYRFNFYWAEYTRIIITVNTNYSSSIDKANCKKSFYEIPIFMPASVILKRNTRITCIKNKEPKKKLCDDIEVK